MTSKTHGVWFRSDLRCSDNPALSAACEDPKANVIGIYIATSKQWQQHHIGNNRQHFTLETVADLRQELHQLNIPLYCLSVNSYSGCAATLLRFCQQHAINGVFANTELEINEALRDQQVASALDTAGVFWRTYHDQTITVPGSVTTKDGNFYKVFTPFKRALIKQLDTRSLIPLPAPQKRNYSVSGSTARDCKTLGAIANINPTFTTPWPTGEEEASKRLKDFIQHKISTYDTQRDVPAAAHTSTLSPYLAVGALSLRQCFYAAYLANNGECVSGDAGIDCWISELIWREFYKHLVVGFPNLCKGQNFNRDYANIPWRDAPSDFEAWCHAKTGYPLVDAAMVQLTTTGWMHNRLRMVAAMFLTKHLLIDWRLGERFFLEHLVDADYAANNGGWQWSASTGADAAPYFRIFNPYRQSERFDTDGEFIVSQLPQFDALSPKKRHNPSDTDRQKIQYCPPIVDHRFGVERAKKAFKDALNKR